MEDTLLIKTGGGSAINWEFIAKDVALLFQQKKKIIIVHGASVIRDEIAQRLGTPTKTITSPSGVSSVWRRYDDPDPLNDTGYLFTIWMW